MNRKNLSVFIILGSLFIGCSNNNIYVPNNNDAINSTVIDNSITKEKTKHQEKKDIKKIKKQTTKNKKNKTKKQKKVILNKKEHTEKKKAINNIQITTKKTIINFENPNNSGVIRATKITPKITVIEAQ